MAEIAKAPKEKEADGFPTKEQIAAWKKEFGEVFSIEVDGYKCILKKPNRTHIAAAMAAGQRNPMKFNDSIMTNCWLWGDNEIKSNDDLYLAACAKLDEVVEFKQAELKKL